MAQYVKQGVDELDADKSQRAGQLRAGRGLGVAEFLCTVNGKETDPRLLHAYFSMAKEKSTWRYHAKYLIRIKVFGSPARSILRTGKWHSVCRKVTGKAHRFIGPLGKASGHKIFNHMHHKYDDHSTTHCDRDSFLVLRRAITAASCVADATPVGCVQNRYIFSQDA